MGLHDSFGHLKHKLWPKERSGVKLTIWLPNTKSWELTRLPCVLVACHILLESSRWRLKLCFKSHLNWRFVHNVMGPQSWDSKVTGVPILGISGLPFRSFGTKCHLDVGLVEKHKVYYKVVASPKFGPWWVLWV
jgi:hypothetical protein